jgi:GMP synthase (glutamine-hydrolysing)
VLPEEIRRAGLYRELWQASACCKPVRSVGVQGDSRTYGYPIVLRAVTGEDAMTADWARLPYDLIETISSRIVNEIPAVNRVVLDVTSKPGNDRVGVASRPDLTSLTLVHRPKDSARRAAA